MVSETRSSPASIIARIFGRGDGLLTDPARLHESEKLPKPYASTARDMTEIPTSRLFIADYQFSKI